MIDIAACRPSRSDGGISLKGAQEMYGQEQDEEGHDDSMSMKKSVTAWFYAGSLMVPVVAGAATLEQMQQLDAVTPPGSKIICVRHYPARDAAHPALKTVTTGQVTHRDGLRTDYQVNIAFFRPGISEPDTVLHYTQTVALEAEASLSMFAPESLHVTLAGGSADSETRLADRIRREQPMTDRAPYSETEFMRFPDHVIHQPGVPAAYCHVEDTGKR